MKEVRPTLVGESHVDYDKLASEQEIKAAHAAAASVNKSSDELADALGIKDEMRAKYKIEVTFGPKRTTQGPNRVAIQIWESGKRLHGGGDELMFFCKDNRAGHDEGCWAPIPADQIKGGVAYCIKCAKAINAEYLTNMKVGYTSTRFLCTEIAKLFHQLNSNADIYLKFHKSDIRYRAMLKAKGEEVARRLKGMHIYPLKNILKDTSNGAGLENRLFAFVTN